jgi:peptidoglycan L-alanyl-D-glutamate endopeptidase CwlK
MPELEALSNERLKGVNPKLVDVVKQAATASPFPIRVTEGLRSAARQNQLYAQGRTKPGKIVTWTRNSKHMMQSDGTGHAVDLAPLIDGAIPWSDKTRFRLISDLMQAAAEDVGITVRWGADWNRNGVPWQRGEYDGPHFEIAALTPVVAVSRVPAVA